MVGWRPKEISQRPAEAIASAAGLAEYLRAGGSLQAQACPIRLDPGEHCYVVGQASLSQYHSLDVTYSQSMFIAGGGLGMIAATAGTSAILNSRRRDRARREAQAQWRYLGRLPLVGTSTRIMLMEEGRWLSWWHGAVRQLVPRLSEMGLDIAFDNTPPIRLEGDHIPWLAVMLSWLVFGQVLDISAPPALPPAR